MRARAWALSTLLAAALAAPAGAQQMLFQEWTSTNSLSIAGTNWTTPTNIQTNNDAYAVYNNGGQDWLTAKSWGVNLPGPVVIHGIMLVVQGNGPNSQTGRREFDVALTKDGTNTVGTVVLNNLLPQTTDADVAVSTAAALWGTTWTEAELESANWGVMIRDANTQAHVINFDSMTVTYAYKTIDQVTSTRTVVIPGTVQQNSAFAAMRLNVGTNRNTADWLALRVSTTGTLSPISVSSVTLYRDTGNGTFGAEDTLVSYATNTFNSVGNVDLRLASPQTLTAAGGTYFVVLNVISTAAVGGTIGVTLHSQGAFSLSEPDTVTTTNFPLSSGNASVVDGPDTITVTPTSQAPANANQGTSFSVLRLAMLTDQEDAQLSALTVTRSGTLGDSGVSAVNLYRDTNADGLFDGGDTLVGGPATFSGGTANLTVSPVVTLLTASTNYFLVYTLSATAAPGATIGGAVQLNTHLTLTAPDLTRTTNFPAASSNTTVDDVADTVTVTPAGLSPGSVVQGTEFAAEKFALATGADEAVWTAIQVSTKGTLSPASITTVKIYRDTGNGTYGGEDTLISPAVTTFSGGSAEITLDTAQTITTSAQNYYVVYSLAGSANPGDTTGVAIHAESKFTLSGIVDTVSATNFPVSTNLATVIAQGQTVTALEADMAPGTIAQNTADTAMLRFTLDTPSGSAEWTALTVTKKGTLADSGVSTVKIYLDDGDNGFDAGDTLVSPANNTFTSGAVNITLSAAQTITATPQVYLVVYSLAAFPTPGDTIGAEVTSNAHLTVTSPDVVATTNFPLASTNATVTDVADTLTVTPTALSPGTVQQGTDYATQKLSLAVNQDFTVWTALTVTQTGTLADSGIDSVKVYLDDGDDGYDAGDTLISPAVTTFSGGTANITLDTPQTLTTAPQVYFVVLTLDTLAGIGDTVATRVANAAALTVSGTDSVAATNLPASSGDSTVTDAADTVTVTPTPLAPGTVLQGAAYAVESFSLVTNQETATWTALQVSTTGTLAPILVSSVTVYLDANANSTFEPASDTLVSPAVTTFTGGAANITLSAAQTINTTPKVYFVVYGLISTATVGGTVGATFPSAGKFTLSGVDAVSASNFPASSGNSTLTDRGDDVVITPTDLGGGQVGQGETHACLKLSLFTPLDASTWTAVTVSTIGTLAPASLDSARVYLDDGDGVFDAGLDTLISPAVTTFTGGSAAITLSAAQVITDTAKDYFLVIVVNVGATVGNTVGLRVHHPGHFTFSSPDPSSGTFPVNGTVSTVAAPDTVTVTPTSVEPGLIGQGADYAVMKLSAVTNGNAASMTAIRVTKGGSTNRTNITSVKIFYDADGNGYYDDNDTALGSGVYPGGGAVTITLGPAQTLTTTPKAYFVVHALTAGIPLADTVGADLTAATEVTIASPDTIATTNFPYSSRLSTVQAADYGVLLDQSLINVGSIAINQDYLVTTPVVVLSTGNIGATFAVRAATVTAGSPWTIAAAPAPDQFTAHGLFNSVQPALGDFGASDLLSDSNTTCLGGKFVGDQDCRVVRAGDARNLWIKLGLPTQSTSEAQQDIQVTVTAIVP